MKTLRKTDGENTSFIIADVAEKYHDAVRSLYYTPVAEGFAKTYPTDTLNLDHIFQNFECHAQEIVLQTARVHPVDWKKSLSTFIQIIKNENIDWWLTGSAALAVRGIDIVPGDLDLVVGDSDAPKLGDLLSDYLVEPMQPSSGWIWNWFGRAFLYARLEWIGGVNEGADNPQAADFGPTAAQRLEIVNWHGNEVKVPPLDLQLDVCKRRGLAERVEKINRFLLNGK